LNFNRSFEKPRNEIMLTGGIMPRGAMAPKNWVARPATPFLARFLGKFVLDIMPAALASVIGGFLFTQYQFGHAGAHRPAAEAAAPASAEMLALVRDEHAVILDYLKTQMAAEKNRQAVEERSTDAPAADTETGAAKPVALRIAMETPARRPAVATATPRSSAPHAKPPAAAMVAAWHAPLVIAQAEPITAPAAAAAPSDRLASDPNSLLGKTLDLKDHVVAATRHVVFAIGDVFASLGERIGGITPAARQFSSDS
jgi:hypothetical protein